jgi:hypothetical protein
MKVLLSLCLSYMYGGFSIFTGNAAKHRIPLLSRPRASVAVAAEYHISFSSIRSRIMHKLTQFRVYVKGGVYRMRMYVLYMSSVRAKVCCCLR